MESDYHTSTSPTAMPTIAGETVRLGTSKGTIETSFLQEQLYRHNGRPTQPTNQSDTSICNCTPAGAPRAVVLASNAVLAAAQSVTAENYARTTLTSDYFPCTDTLSAVLKV